MAFRYDINLVREQTNRERRQRALAHVLTGALLLLTVMLIVTYGIYLTQDQKITETVRTTELLVRRAEEMGVSAGDVDRLRQQSSQLQSEIAQVADVVRASASWSHVLVSLGECCRSDKIGLRRVDARMSDETACIFVQGACTAENPVFTVNSFMQVVADHEAFGPGKLLTMTKEKAGPSVFEAEIPLHCPTVAHTHPPGT